MQTKPTLLVTTSTFPRWEGDREPRFVYDLSKRLTTTFNVVVLAPHSKGAAVKELWDGMFVYRYRYAPEKLETLAYAGGITANLKQNPWKLALLPLFLLGQWWAVIKLLKQYPVDTIHAHWLIPQGLVAAIALLGKKQSISLVCTSHGGDLFGLQDKISLLLKRWTVSRCSELTVVSQAMLAEANRLVGTQSKPISIIPMGTDLKNTFIYDPQIERFSNRLLFVGRLVEKKGLIYLLEAFQQLLTKQPSLELIIAGSGPLKDDLLIKAQQLGIEQQTIFKGRLTHIELVKLYQTSTVAVFPFIQSKDGDMEGLGLVMVEAIGCGCPVIASDLPAVRDVICHGETGYLVESSNSAALAQVIQNLVTQQEIREQLSIQALKSVQNTFDWESITQDYKKVLHEQVKKTTKLEVVHVN